MNLQSKKILVAGGAGFIGSYVVEELVQAGAAVTVLDDLSSGNMQNLKHLIDKIQFIHGSINDYQQTASAARGQDIIIHEAFPASLCSLSPEHQFIETGTLGTYNLLRLAVENKSIFIYASSISVYGKQLSDTINEDHPLDPIITYGATKLSGEIYCRAFEKEYGLNFVILRYSDVYGPRFKRTGAPIAFLLRALNSEPLQVHGDGSQARDYTFVTDIAKGTILALQEPAFGKTVNIASGNSCTILDLANKVNIVTGNNAGIKIISEDLINSNKYIINDKRIYNIDITRARDFLGYEPETSLDRGLRISKKWILDNLNV